MAYWLMKTEPGTWSWDDQVKEGTTYWDGVRNFQASNNMKKMKIGDRCFFYHSGKERQIVGVVEVVKAYYADHTDQTGRFGMVDVKTIGPLAKPVTLAAIKADPDFADFLLVRASRLSVMPVSAAQWKGICGMGGGAP